MDAARVQALMAELASADENTRLRAANAFVKAEGSAAKAAVPRLREVFHGDPNPAVKFLAKKALLGMGETLDPQAKPSEVLPVASKAESYQSLDDGRVLWRVAQDLLKPQIEALLRLPARAPEAVQDRLAYAIERLGAQESAGPLIQAYLAADELRVAPGEVDTPDAGRSLSQADIDQALHAARLKRSGINPATAAAMGNLDVPEVFSVLTGMLEDPRRFFSQGALAILAAQDGPKAEAPLFSVLGSGHPALDEPILKRLLAGATERPESRRALVAAAGERLRRGGAARARQQAVRLLGRLGDTTLLDEIREALSDDSPEVTAEAVRALASFDLPDTWLVSNIRPTLRSRHPYPAASAAIALLGGPGETHAKAAIEGLRGGPPAGRIALAEALSFAMRVEATPVLEALLRDPDAGVREAAIAAARRIDVPEVVEFLGGHLADEDEALAVAAIETVGRLKLEEFNDILALLVDDAATPRLRATILASLGRMGLAENLPTIAHFLSSDDPRVRANAIEALEGVGDAKSMSLVHLSLSDPHPRVVANACKALYSWGELPVREKVQALLEGDEALQAAGCHALGDIFFMTRNEAELIDKPLLVKALRQAPRYGELRRIVLG